MTKPTFKVKTDGTRMYYTGYSNVNTNCVISIGKNNYEIPGEPKLNVRTGNSNHGPEMFVEHLVDGKIIKREKNSKYDTIEIYFPLKYGIDFFKTYIDYIENQGVEL